MKKATPAERPAEEFVNVKDIKGQFLYTKDGYIICFLRVYPYNLDLLSGEEKRSKTNVLSASFEGDRKDFAYLAYPREIDLDSYKNQLKKQYNNELASIGRKRLLREMIMEANELATSGENYEHQHFIRLWKYAGSNTADAENEIRTRMAEFKERYGSAGIETEIMKDQDILKLCNLFGNSIQAPFASTNSSMTYEPITKLR